MASTVPHPLLPTMCAHEFHACHETSSYPIRRPLRERCAVALQIQTSCFSPIPPKVLLEPHVNNHPRRKRAQAGIAQSKKKRDGGSPAELQCLQELIPGLFLAFADDATYTKHFRYKGTEPKFTHILSICTTPDAWASACLDAEGVHRLRLVVSPFAINDNGRTNLTMHQLLVARDFLSLAMPYSHEDDLDSDVRLLITTPGSDRAVDAMSIAACYLAYASGKEVGEVVGHIDAEHEEMLDVWIGIVSRDGMEVMNCVARM